MHSANLEIKRYKKEMQNDHSGEKNNFIMKSKCLIFILILLLLVAIGFSQDTSAALRDHLKNNSGTLNSTDNLNKEMTNPGASHITVNSNTGTEIPNTTSGTLNSAVNPNTQFVIPIHKSKRKSKSDVIPGSGINIPNKSDSSNTNSPVIIPSKN